MVRVKIKKNTNPQYPTAEYVTTVTCNSCGKSYEFYFTLARLCRFCNEVMEAQIDDLIKRPEMRKAWHRKGDIKPIQLDLYG